MIRFSLLCCVLVCFVKGREFFNGSQTILQKTVEMLFTERSQSNESGVDKLFRISPRQRKMCRRDPGLANILIKAQKQALIACEESFTYDRWNCSIVYNNKPNKSIFAKVYRETAFVHSLIVASISHAVAKGCASGELTKCSCQIQNDDNNMNSSWQFKRSGCSDDFKYGKRIARNFLEVNKAVNQIGQILKHDVILGVDAIGLQMSEVCKCHGFSGSCTTKTCWKRLAPFNSAMGSLKKLYRHAVKRKVGNATPSSSVTLKVRKNIQMDKKRLIFIQKSPNLCFGTKKRECRNPDNCATLCCGRGFVTRKKKVKTKCKCRMVNCCFVQCDTCVDEIDYYVCK